MGIKEFFEIKRAQITSKNFPDFIKDKVMDELAKITGKEEISNNKSIVKTKIKKFFKNLIRTQDFLRFSGLKKGWEDDAEKDKYKLYFPEWKNFTIDEEKAVYRKYFESYVKKCARDIRRHLK